MAGIGFELKKLFVGKGVINRLRAYAYSGLICSGTMILAILLLLGIQAEAICFGAPVRVRETLVATMVYALFISMLLTSGLQLYLSRYVADMLYMNKPEKVLPSLFGVSLILMAAGGIGYAALLCSAGSLTLLQRVINWTFFMEMIPVWLMMSYITAVKDFMAVLRAFLSGVLLALVLGPVLMLLKLDCYTALMGALAAGYGLMLCGLLRASLTLFPMSKGSVFDFVAWMSHTPDLLVIGFAVVGGSVLHILIMWFSPIGETVAGLFRQASLFDASAFFAYLVTIPTSINFMVSVEVNFYQRYRDYFDAITGGGTMRTIHAERRRMVETMKQEIIKLAVVQIFAMILYVIAMRFLLQRIGFTIDMLAMFQAMTIGYSLYAVGNAMMQLQLYFDDRKGALLSACVFLAGNLAGTLFSLRMGIGWYGFGVVIGGLLLYYTALVRLLRYVRDIDYHIYCTQPIFNEVRKDRWAMLASRLSRGGGSNEG